MTVESLHDNTTQTMDTDYSSHKAPRAVSPINDNDDCDDDDDDTRSSATTCSYDSDGSDWSSCEESLGDMMQPKPFFSIIGASPAISANKDNCKTSDGNLTLPTLQMSFSSMDAFGFNENTNAEVKQHMIVRRIKSQEHIQQERSYSCHTEKPRSNSEFDEKSFYSEGKQDTENKTKPEDCLNQLLLNRGITVNKVSAKDLKGFFVEMKPENYEAYTPEIASAVRDGDLSVVQEHNVAGKTLQCCNKFDESVVHTICRRGNDELLRYILCASDASVQICDDQGRTPLHDAAWTRDPNFDLIQMLVETCPDLLYIMDERGFTPLSYAGQQCWDKWCDFLKANEDILAPNAIPI